MALTYAAISQMRDVIHPLWKYFYDCNMEKERGIYLDLLF